MLYQLPRQKIIGTDALHIQLTSGPQYTVSLLAVVVVEPGQDNSLWLTVDIAGGSRFQISQCLSQVDWHLTYHSRQDQHLYIIHIAI